ncbi:hypothetical protein C8J55DRAFT_485845 [Lentinula edodes]|uniref:SAP domain-containing protein n=1 Tax=Lentinula lateritia TaxID=40482 RepID=A0A9W9AY69_9AGAR|nr:hypothetical protein C8J55DRAFT_485845 [Lentinula edodes]
MAEKIRGDAQYCTKTAFIFLAFNSMTVVMPRIKFESGDEKLQLPTSSGEIKVVDLTTFKLQDLRLLCKEYGLKNLKRTSSDYLTALRRISKSPSIWKADSSRTFIQAISPSPSKINGKRQPKTPSKNNASSRPKRLPSEVETSKNQKIEEIHDWLDHVHFQLRGSMGINSLILRMLRIPSVAPPQFKASSNFSVILPKHVKVPTIELPRPIEIFSEKFRITLASGTCVYFTTNDIAKYPMVIMPRHSTEDYLNQLLSFWDDALPTWKPECCPIEAEIGGVKLAAKYWKEVFSKAGHWKISRNRTQWFFWRILIAELHAHGDVVGLFCEAYRNHDTGRCLGVKKISDMLRAQRRVADNATKEEFFSLYKADPEFLGTLERTIMCYEDEHGNPGLLSRHVEESHINKLAGAAMWVGAWKNNNDMLFQFLRVNGQRKLEKQVKPVTPGDFQYV